MQPQQQRWNRQPDRLLSAFMLSLPINNTAPLINAHSLTQTLSVHVGMSTQCNYPFFLVGLGRFCRTWWTSNSDVLEASTRQRMKRLQKKPEPTNACRRVNKCTWSPPRRVKSTSAEVRKATRLKVIGPRPETWLSPVGNESLAAANHFNDPEIGDYETVWEEIISHQLVVVLKSILLWEHWSRCELGNDFQGLSSAKRESVFVPDSLCVDVAAWLLSLWSSLQM